MNKKDITRESYEKLANKIHHFSMLRVDSMDSRKLLRDLDDGRLLMRCELQGIMALLIKKGIVTQDEPSEQVIDEMKWLLKILEKKHGFRATDIGLESGQ